MHERKSKNVSSGIKRPKSRLFLLNIETQLLDDFLDVLAIVAVNAHGSVMDGLILRPVVDVFGFFDGQNFFAVVLQEQAGEVVSHAAIIINALHVVRLELLLLFRSRSRGIRGILVGRIGTWFLVGLDRLAFRMGDGGVVLGLRSLGGSVVLLLGLLFALSRFVLLVVLLLGRVLLGMQTDFPSASRVDGTRVVAENWEDPEKSGNWFLNYGCWSLFAYSNKSAVSSREALT